MRLPCLGQAKGRPRSGELFSLTKVHKSREFQIKSKEFVINLPQTPVTLMPIPC